MIEAFAKKTWLTHLVCLVIRSMFMQKKGCVYSKCSPFFLSFSVVSGIIVLFFAVEFVNQIANANGKMEKDDT